MKKTNVRFWVSIMMLLLLAVFALPLTDISAAEEEGQAEVYYGDVDDSGKIDAKDVTALRRYLAGGWNVTVDMDKADIDGNGKVEAKDVTMLRRYLAGGWGVVLPEKESIQENVDGYWVATSGRDLYFVYQEKDDLGNLVSESTIDLTGSVVSRNKYSEGILNSSTIGGNTYIYDKEGKVVQVVASSSDYESKIEYDDKGNVIKSYSVYQDHNETYSYTYDSKGNIISEIIDCSFNDGRTTHCEEYYTIEQLTEPDFQGRYFTSVLANLSAEKSDGSKILYDSETDMIVITSSSGIESVYKDEYDDEGNIIKEYNFFAYLALNSDNYEDGLSLCEYQYDSEGRVTNKLIDNYFGCKYEYDSNGRLLKKTDYRLEGVSGYEYEDVDEIMNYEYDDSGILIREFSSYKEKKYNSQGQVSEEIEKYFSGSIKRTIYEYDSQGFLCTESIYRDDKLKSKYEYIDEKLIKRTEVENIYDGCDNTIVYYYDVDSNVYRSTIISGGMEYESYLRFDDQNRVIELPFESADDIEGMGRSAGQLRLCYEDNANLKATIVWRKTETPDPSWREEYIFDLRNKTYIFCNNGMSDAGKLYYYEYVYDDEWNVLKKREKIYTKKEGGAENYYGKELLTSMEWTYDSNGNEMSFSFEGYNGKKYEYDMSSGKYIVSNAFPDYYCVCAFEEIDMEKNKCIETYHFISGEKYVEESTIDTEGILKPVRRIYTDWDGLDFVTDYAFDSEGMLIGELDNMEMNSHIVREYSTDNILIKKTETSIDYDGILVKITIYNEDGSKTVRESSTQSYTYGETERDFDKNGNELRYKRIDPDGSSCEKYYNKDGECIKEIWTDVNGTVEKY